MMGHYSHSLSADAAIMVSEQPNYWWKHCHVFDTIGYPYQTEYDLFKNTLDGFKCLLFKKPHGEIHFVLLIFD